MTLVATEMIVTLNPKKREWNMGEGRRRKLAQEQRLAQMQAMPPSPWQLSNALVQCQLEDFFASHGIDYSRPGFQDSAPFLAEEARRPEILVSYARYVEVRGYTDVELAEAQRKIEVAAEVVSAAVKADGGMGKCVVASGVLSRILDELGVWNYCAKATLTVTFPPAVSKERQYFFAVDEGNFVAPHAMVVAPPFLVVDTTAAAQSYRLPAMNAALPDLIMERQFIPYAWTDQDIASPEAQYEFAASRTSLRRYLKEFNPQMLQRMRDFPGRSANFPDGSLDYVIVAVGGYAEQIGDMTHPNTHLDGKTPLSLLEDLVRPRLANLVPAPLG